MAEHIFRVSILALFYTYMGYPAVIYPLARRAEMFDAAKGVLSQRS